MIILTSSSTLRLSEGHFCVKFNFCNERWKIILSHQWGKLYPHFFTPVLCHSKIVSWIIPIKYFPLIWLHSLIGNWAVWPDIQRSMFTNELSSKVLTPPSVMPDANHLLSVSSNTQSCLDGLNLCWHQYTASNIAQLLSWRHREMYTVPEHGNDTM